MEEEELLEALERETKHIGVLPVLSLLLDRITRGVYLELFADLSDMAAEIGGSDER